MEKDVMRVIYIDDEEPGLRNFKMIAQTVTKISELHLFSSAKEANAFLRNRTVDMVIADVEMIGAERREMRKLRRQNPRLPIICMASTDAVDTLGLSPVGWLFKPCTAREVSEALSDCSIADPCARQTNSQKQKFLLPLLHIKRR